MPHARHLIRSILAVAALAVFGLLVGCTASNSSADFGPAIPPSGNLPIMYEFYTDW